MKRQPKAAAVARDAHTHDGRSIAKVSHTLAQFFKRGDDQQLGSVLRRNGAGRRRKQRPSPSG